MGIFALLSADALTLTWQGTAGQGRAVQCEKRRRVAASWRWCMLSDVCCKLFAVFCDASMECDVAVHARVSAEGHNARQSEVVGEVAAERRTQVAQRTHCHRLHTHA